MYNSTFPLVNRLVWKLVFLFFLFRLQLFIIINQDVCVFFWLEDGKEVTKPIGKTKYRIPLVCVISVSSNLAHFPFCCWMSKWFFFFLRKRFFHSWITRHFVRTFVRVDFFVRFFFFIVKLGITFLCVSIYSHLEFTVLSFAVLPSPPPFPMCHQLKFMCWVCNTFCWFFFRCQFCPALHYS